MARGDHVWCWRLGYTHHGIDLGDGRVVHYAGLADGLKRAPVEVASMDHFANGSKVHVRRYKSRAYGRDEACRRALSRLGEDAYSVVMNNCEHFASWCITGLPLSYQTTGGVAVGMDLVRAVADTTGPWGTADTRSDQVGTPGGVVGGIGSVAGAGAMAAVMMCKLF